MTTKRRDSTRRIQEEILAERLASTRASARNKAAALAMMKDFENSGHKRAIIKGSRLKDKRAAVDALRKAEKAIPDESKKIIAAKDAEIVGLKKELENSQSLITKTVSENKRLTVEIEKINGATRDTIKEAQTRLDVQERNYKIEIKALEVELKERDKEHAKIIKLKEKELKETEAALKAECIKAEKALAEIKATETTGE
jgi:hypothetical protein